MIALDVRSNIRDVRARFGELRKSVEEAATVRALNRTITTVRAQAQREIRKEYPGLKAGTVREELKVERATRAVMVAKITVQGRRLPLIEFVSSATVKSRMKRPGRNIGGGVRVKIKGQSKMIPHAFIAQTKSGHVGVFVRAPSSKTQGGQNMEFRVGKGSRLRDKGNDLPIAQLSSISLPKAFVNKKIQTELRRLGRETFLKNLRAELKFRTSGSR